jgi:hypothetical protein
MESEYPEALSSPIKVDFKSRLFGDFRGPGRVQYVVGSFMETERRLKADTGSGLGRDYKHEM